VPDIVPKIVRPKTPGGVALGIFYGRALHGCALRVVEIARRNHVWSYDFVEARTHDFGQIDSDQASNMCFKFMLSFSTAHIWGDFHA